MKAPSKIQEMADGLGFAIREWDEVSGALSGHGQTFIGSHDEVSAYLQAWDACEAPYTRLIQIEKT